MPKPPSKRDDMITVFYDGKCSVCAKEIAYYRKIAADGIFDWQDITECADGLKAEGISLAEGLKLLHARDADGTLCVGVDAFILIWRQLKRWRLLATFVSLPVIYKLADIAYHAFAERRFKKLAHCQLAAKNDHRL